MDVAGVPRTFESLHRDLLPGGPHVQPKPWESIASESGAAVEGPASVAGKVIYRGDDACSISENELVRLVLNALQGVKSAVDSIEKLSSLFLLIPADRSYHSIPSVWCPSLSTNALGKILQSLGQSGSVICFLRNFVDYFLNSGSAKVRGAAEEATTVLPRGGLVNQAFAVAVRKILEKYMCALNTLYESVKLRRFAGSADGSVDDSFRHGCLTSIAHSDITVLEVHLHTKELLTHIESLGNICLFGSQVLNASVEALAHRISNESYTIPAGSDLLTYLYTLLRYADPVHRSLLEFLFVQSCEPYCGFIKSWIYGASVDDPYKEFVARDMEDSVSWMHLKNTNNNSFQFGSEKDQPIAVPCFLEDVRIPLLRTGLQLQVLIKMLNICKWNIANTRGYTKPSPFELEEVLPFWREYFTGDISHTSTFFFGKKAMNTLVLSRKKAFSLLWKNLETFLSRMDLACDQNSPNENLSPIVDEQCRSNDISEYPLTNPHMRLTKPRSEFLVVDVSSASESITSENLHSSECSSLNSFEDSSDSEDFVESCVSGTVSELLQSLLSKPKVETVSLIRDLQNSCPSHLLLLNEECRIWAPLENKYTVIDEAGSVQIASFVDADDNDLTSKTYAIDESLTYENPYASMEEFISFKFNSKFNEWNFDGMNENFVELLNASELRFHFLDLNPMLTKKARLDLTGSSIDEGFRGNRNFMFPCYDFSSVKDPCKEYGENFEGSSNDELFTNAVVPFEKVRTLLAKQQRTEQIPPISGDDIVSQDEIGRKDYTYSNHSLKMHAISCSSVSDGVNAYGADKHITGSNFLVNDCNLITSSTSMRDCCPNSTSNGSSLETLSQCSSQDVRPGSAEQMISSLDMYEVPLDIAIDQCILQEILLQYDYISRFTVKMLEKGFYLQEHLSALKRYYFMELADWADYFILSLWLQRSHVSKSNQRLPEILGLLDSALQKSSCEIYRFKDRLFVFLEEVDDGLCSSSTLRISAFNCVTLGYIVNWPVNIILSPTALNVYSKIFKFLTQIKLSVCSLNHVWCLLKDMKYLDSRLSMDDIKCFKFITRMRQQLNHFVCTLQQYVQSQLSHVSWCNFIVSLRNQVKDILDLESLHMSYLADALLICFLSNEARHTADVILRILQCALDFEACCSGVIGVPKLDGDCSILPATLINEVSVIKSSFEEHLKELYICYQKTPKHRQFGLHQFWEYLNYNDYFSNSIMLAASRNVESISNYIS